MIRPVRDGDVPAVRRLFLELVPEIPVGTEAGFRHWLGSHPPRARFHGVVAEEAGEIVGWSQAFFDWHTSEEAAGRAWVGVLPAHRGRGLGRALAVEADTHVAAIGARSVESFAPEDSVGQAFAERRGFVQQRTEIFSSVDPQEVDLGELEPLEARLGSDGLRLAALSDLRDRPEAFHDLDVAVGSDVPGEEDMELRYDEWLVGTFGAPDLSWAGSTVVFDGGRPVAFCLLQVVPNERRAENDFTATRPEYRGRGLARLVKLASLRWCAENGIDRVYTGNDETNAPMRAVNRRLGYRETVRRAWLGKSLV